MSKNALKITREENFADWYQEVIKEADLAENACVRGCMVIKPYGYALWENIKNVLNKKIVELGVQNAYFPLLIPLEFLEKEAEHVAGFAKECAVVTHHRLIQKDGKLIPDGELENPFIIRPTSETIVGESFSKWINSHRDLPMKINQWANVMRWEMRTRMFLRTSEFLWQEGHNVFASAEEADEDAKIMLKVYNWFITEYLAIYGLQGQKTDDEKFPGADITYTIEPIMQDGKSVQSCTSHNLGQHFTKSCNIKFTNEEQKEQLAFSTSWGISTRIIGALIMSHSDDDGLVLPPKIAPYKIVIIPIIHNEDDKNQIIAYCEKIKNSLNVECYIDLTNKKSQDKKWEWIKKGTPIRIEIGMKELQENNIFYVERLNLQQKNLVKFDEFISNYQNILDNMQTILFEKNKKHLFDKIVEVQNISEIPNIFKNQTCFVLVDKVLWKNPELEKIMEEFSLSYRCLPFEFKDKLIIGKSY